MLFAGLIIIVLVIFIFLFVIYIVAEPHPSLIRHESEMFFVDPKNNNEKFRFPHNTDAASVDLTVVVPAYNEEERMPQMLNEAVAFLNKRQKNNPTFTYEIIIVDDGSKDGTTKTGLLYVEKYGVDKIRVLTLEKNRGKGGAVRLGVLSSRGRKILYADADGATKFSDVDKLEKKLDQEVRKTPSKLVVVCGSRAHLEKDSIATRTYFRTILMYGFHFVVWLLCVRGVKDTQCGFKLLSRKAALLLFRNLHVERWAFDVDILYLAQYFKMTIGEVAVTWEEIEGSKLVPFWSWLQMGRDLFLIWLHYSIGAWKCNSKPKIT